MRKLQQRDEELTRNEEGRTGGGRARARVGRGGLRDRIFLTLGTARSSLEDNIEYTSAQGYIEIRDEKKKAKSGPKKNLTKCTSTQKQKQKSTHLDRNTCTRFFRD